jgi:hypothetical protein
MHMACDEIPSVFCWTRFGTEAGETIEEILARKERERSASGGLFLWGIGNSIAPALAELVRRDPNPAVLFSPIRSRPRAADVAPERVVSWIGGKTLAGEPIELDSRFLVTSRASSARPRPHYALVCRSESSLELSDSIGSLSLARLRNLLSGRPVGASQTTAVVERDSRTAVDGTLYPVALRAALAPPYFIRLETTSQLTMPRAEAA